MKSFLYSLIVFILFMCSCKSKKIDTNVRIRDDVRSEFSYWNNYVRIDTTRILYFDRFTNNLIIEETITEREYDKDTGTLTKETETKREIRQDSDKVVTEEEQKGKGITENDSTHHITDASKKIDSEVKEEIKDSTESFWSWLGIVVGVIIGITIFVKTRKR